MNKEFGLIKQTKFIAHKDLEEESKLSKILVSFNLIMILATN